MAYTDHCKNQNNLNNELNLPIKKKNGTEPEQTTSKIPSFR
jgi:hypothetical protein